MDDLRGLHSITASMHEGMLTLAIVCVVLRILFGGKSEDLRKYTETTTLVASVGGTIGIILSGVTGSMLRPVGVLFSSPIILNKIMFTVFITGLWTVFVFAQVKYRDRLWSQRSLSIFASALAVLGYGGVMFVGSTGGHLAGKESILDPFYQLLSAGPENLWVASPFEALAKALQFNPFSLTLNATSLLQFAIIVNVVTIVVTIAYVSGIFEAFKKWVSFLRRRPRQKESEGS